MKEKKEFDIEKSIIPNHTMVIPKILDPYTAKIARFLYNLGFSANFTTFLTFLFGMSGIAVMILIPNYVGLVIAAVLITLRNIGDTVDGKIARGSNTPSPIGGFADIITDWLFFHAAFFIAVGYLTDNIIIGFLCVTGYMSREFARTKFTHFYGKKITETKEAEKLPLVVAIARRYDLGTVTWLIPPVMVLVNPVWIIYFVAIAEYGLLFGELGFDVVCFLKKKKNDSEREECLKEQENFCENNKDN